VSKAQGGKKGPGRGEGGDVYTVVGSGGGGGGPLVAGGGSGGGVNKGEVWHTKKKCSAHKKKARGGKGGKRQLTWGKGMWAYLLGGLWLGAKVVGGVQFRNEFKETMNKAEGRKNGEERGVCRKVVDRTLLGGVVWRKRLEKVRGG